MTTPLLQNVLNQAEALRQVADYQMGAGSAALQAATEMLRAKKRILLSGMGASYFACIPLRYMLAQSGFDVACIETAELLYFLPSAFNDQTAVILVSRSGETIEVIKLLPELRKRGASVIAVVNIPGSSLSKQADVTIELGCPPDQLVAIQTYTATLSVLALLHATMLEELPQANAELSQVVQMLEAGLPTWVSARKEWTAFLEGGAPLYILGRGPAMASVLEGVLLMHETAKAPAVGMSVPQFRHGPVEVVDSRFRAVVIGARSEALELDRGLVSDVQKMGGDVRWLEPSGASMRFSSILEIIPLQLAAYVRAEMAGIKPGDFRWAAAITSSETGF